MSAPAAGVSVPAAVVLAGGESRRMGRDKLAEPVGGVPLLDRVLAACASADPVVVVGDPRPVALPVSWAREDPPGGGPVPALAAGLSALPEHQAYALVLAGDLPFVTPAHLEALVAALLAEPAAAGALAVDADGREQALLACWRVAPLRDVLARTAGEGPLAGRRLHRTLAPLPRVGVALGGTAAYDCDTPDDLARARRNATSP